MKYLWLILFMTSSVALAQVEPPTEKPGESPGPFDGIEFRSIGPAFMSGRISDIAIDTANENHWYVAAGSGGVWKTLNAGVTWTPVFDDQVSYSIGCVTIDPQCSHTVWVGTGENVGGRHVGFGDGVYRSDDAGQSWKCVGLKDSEHISEILVHPQHSNTVWVASQGPLWKEGGERGVYKTSDGGLTWTRTLGDDVWVGATDLVMDPRNPDLIYAATWQRHRNVASYLGGGEGSGIHRSTDGGETWQELKAGLPESSMGKIGLAISPQNPDVLYAVIELDRRTGAFYRSADGGSSWEKKSDTVSGATGPHYYQELYASPHAFDRVYLADVRIQVSDNGGETFRRLQEQHKHSDNHALAFRASDPNYLLVGTDGGLYESLDLARNWRFFENLPLTQFYKLALDDTEPFYNIYGGTQDNSTEGGPSRTDNAHGIQNSDWRVILDWDGHQTATEPGNPNIVYAERQEGYLTRIDMSTGEIVDIQPQAEAGGDFERFNWDSPILISPHKKTRIFFASHRVWKSENRGDEWTAISGDLTRNQNRFELPIMGETQSWDNAWDISAMSTYNTITSLAESPHQEGLLYAGTDDGLIHTTEDGGQNWRKIEVQDLPGVPDSAFVNDIKADLFDPNCVYVALDNHKFGDFTPYLFKSMDRGRTWESIRGNIPDRTLVWRIIQDHVKKELMFIGTEFGIYVTVDAGASWTRLKGGLPTISFRDLAIQRREDDLVGASFGRGFFVMDDLSVFREVSSDVLNAEATLFSTRKAWWYFPRPHLGFEGGRGDQGASHFVAPNPPFGAVFTYHLSEALLTRRELRAKAEEALKDGGQGLDFPGWDEIERERTEQSPKIWLTIQDSDGQVVRRVEGPTTRGFHRVSWDLRYPPPNSIKLMDSPPEVFGDAPKGLLAAPGRYQVSLCKQVEGIVTELSVPREFDVVAMHSPKGDSLKVVAGFWREYESAVHAHTSIGVATERLLRKVDRMGVVIANSRASVGPLDVRLHGIRQELNAIDRGLNGHRSKQQPGEKNKPTIGDRLSSVARGVDRSSHGPTKTHRRSLEIANDEIRVIRVEIQSSAEKLSALAKELVAAGAPWIEGEPLWSADQ